MAHVRVFSYFTLSLAPIAATIGLGHATFQKEEGIKDLANAYAVQKSKELTKEEDSREWHQRSYDHSQAIN